MNDKTIELMLRHKGVGLTLNVYLKSASESQASALDALSEKLETYCDLAMKPSGRVV